jgi:hypothetical protein
MLGMTALSAYADDRLKMTGYVDNHISLVTNRSRIDDDLTVDDDDRFMGRSRARLFFNIIAAPDSKAVVALEFDQLWGSIDRDTANSRDGDPGFDLGIDNDVLELKHLYVDFKIPGTPVRLQIGGFRHHASRLQDCILLCIDAGGIAAHIDLAPPVKLYVHYMSIQEEDDAVRGGPSFNLGEDWGMGTTLMTEFAKGIKINLAFEYVHEVGPSIRDTRKSQNFRGVGFIRAEQYYIELDARLRFGNFTFSPTFIYNGGQWEFASGLADSDIKAFMVDVRAAYKIGALTLTGVFVYTPGNEASDDLGPGSDINFYNAIRVDGVFRSVRGFEILGFNIDTTSGDMFGDSRGLDDNLSMDQFGVIHVALKADYKISKMLKLYGAVGLFWSDEDVGRPARLGPACSPGATGCNATFNYTGNDNYLGTEIDVVLSYQIFPKATVNVYMAYAFIGDAYNLQHPGEPERDADDSFAAGTRIIYRY